MTVASALAPAVASRWLTAQQAADHVGLSLRAFHARTATRSVPLIRQPGTRRMLFDRDQLDAWLEGADLEVVEKPNGTVLVKAVS